MFALRVVSYTPLYELYMRTLGSGSTRPTDRSIHPSTTIPCDLISLDRPTAAAGWLDSRTRDEDVTCKCLGEPDQKRGCQEERRPEAASRLLWLAPPHDPAPSVDLCVVLLRWVYNGWR
jgi:hypothetical protein